jgi:hypothetical protein
MKTCCLIIFLNDRIYKRTRPENHCTCWWIFGNFVQKTTSTALFPLTAPNDKMPPFIALKYVMILWLQVAWMHFEQSAILTVNSHVITRNPRITVSHDKHRTWFLHINNVQQEDRGRYMCQINTITAKTQIGYLNVVGELCLIYICNKSDIK